MVHKYCAEIERLLASHPNTHSIYHYTTLNPVNRTNSAFLICAFQIIVLRRRAEESWERMRSIGTFLDYRDAGFGGCTYKCSVLHCLQGLEKAIDLGWYNYTTFNINEYETLQRIENGDINWIIPGKFIAFSCPANTSLDYEGFKCYTPEDYCRLFKTLGVTSVIRLNKKTYDASRFKNNGMKHYDLYFLDGSCPSEDLILKFISLCELEAGAIAVHCKAGLGRTGTLIACYAMKHFSFPAPALIGWIRICRPGSILGPQQHFLIEMEQKCQIWGKNYYENKRTIATKSKYSQKRSMSPEDFIKAQFGDKGQAERLILAKRNNQSLTPGRKILSPIPRLPRRLSRPKAINQNIFISPQRNYRATVVKKF